MAGGESGLLGGRASETFEVRVDSSPGQGNTPWEGDGMKSRSHGRGLGVALLVLGAFGSIVEYSAVSNGHWHMLILRMIPIPLIVPLLLVAGIGLLVAIIAPEIRKEQFAGDIAGVVAMFSPLLTLHVLSDDDISDWWVLLFAPITFIGESGPK
jgi:hypothetical protein